MSKEFLTIVIPAFNAEESIIKTLNSLSNQTNKDFKIIVVDDGSTDSTLEICKNLSNKFSDLKIYSKLNGGVSSARNYGLSKVTTDYVSFLDSDDSLHENYVFFMEQQINDNPDFVYCGFVRESENGIVKKPKKFSESKMFLDYIRGVSHVQTACIMMKTSVLLLNDIRFNETLNWGEDIDFFIRVLNKSDKIIAIKDYFVNYMDFDTGNRLSTFNKENIYKEIQFLKTLERNSEALSKDGKDLVLNFRIQAQILRYLKMMSFEDYAQISDSDKDFIIQALNRGISLKSGLRGIKLFIDKKKLREKFNI